MTYKQLEQYLKTERFREGAARGVDMCGRYARCAYCDRLSAYPCAYAYDALVKENKQIPSWQIPEPPVKEKFGTDFADPEPVRDAVRGDEEFFTAEDAAYFESAAVRSIGENAESFSEGYAVEEKPKPLLTAREKGHGIIRTGRREGDSVRVLTINKRSK